MRMDRGPAQLVRSGRLQLSENRQVKALRAGGWELEGTHSAAPAVTHSCGRALSPAERLPAFLLRGPTMKAGFLSRPPRPTETPRQHAQEHAAPAPAQPASVAGTPAHQSGDSPAAPLQLSQEQWASNFAQCLELLRSPADETK